MGAEVKVTYGGIDIAYNEEQNRWEFELRGRERFADSLAKAKEAIDKPEPKTAKKFVPIRAFMNTYGGVYVGTITSIAESGNRLQEVWFTRDSDKRRTKERLDRMKEFNEANQNLVAEHDALQKEAETLRKKAEQRLSLLTPLTITIPE